MRVRTRRAVVVAPVAILVMWTLGSARSPASAAGASGDPGAVVFAGSGAGEMRTAEFALQPGNHRLDYQVSAPAGATDCGMGFRLVSVNDTSYLAGIGSNGATVQAGAPYSNQTWMLVPAAGAYALEVTGDCDWEAALSAMASPLEQAPFVIAGSGPVTSPSFPLAGGDHVIRYRATNPSTTEACIFFGPGIIDASTASMVGDPVDTVVDPGATLEGELIAYGVPEGRYSFSINLAWCQAGLGEPIAWEVVIDPS